MKRLIESTILPLELYIERSADRQLASVIQNMGRPGYILVARQMGKTNLLIHAKRTLETSGLKFAYIDLSNKPRSARECFRSITDSLINAIGVAVNSEAGQIEVRRGGADIPAHKEHESELLLLLRAYDGKLVVVLDEIDALAGTEFADEVFAQIRSSYFSRISFNEFNRITYVLSGVVEPSDLIRDPKRSPFNIGEKIYLDDFSTAEVAKLFEKAKLVISPGIVDRVHSWTGGHPRMVWDLASAIENRLLEGKAVAVGDVDQLVRTLYLTTFDLSPVNNVRDLVRADPEIRGAIRALQNGTKQALPEWVKRKLYLAGATRFCTEEPGVALKGDIFVEALRAEWIDEIESRESLLPSRADEQFQLGNFSKAIELYQELIRTRNDLKDEELSLLYLQIGRCFRAQRQFQDAVIWLNKCRFVSTEYQFRAVFDLGLVETQLGNYAVAEGHFRQVMDKHKRSILRCRAMINLGAALLQLNRENDEISAEKLFEDTVSELSHVDFDDVNQFSELRLVALYNIASLKEKKGDIAGAKTAYHSALDVGRSEYIPGLYLCLIKHETNDVERSKLISDACEYIYKSRLRFSDKGIDLVGGSDELNVFDASVWLSMIKVAFSAGLYEQVRRLVGVAIELQQIAGDPDEVMLELAIKHVGVENSNIFRRILSGIIETIDHSTTANRSTLRRALAWEIINNSDIPALYIKSIKNYSRVLWEDTNKGELGTIDFLALVRGVVFLRNRKDIGEAWRLIEGFAPYLRLVGEPCAVNGFIYYFLRAQIGKLKGLRTDAFGAADECLRLLEKVVNPEATVLAAGSIEEVRRGALQIRMETAEGNPTKRIPPKVGRNEPCPCGSGKKYKYCHGK